MLAMPRMANLRLLLAATLIAAASALSPAHGQEVNEFARAVKATFLYKFAPFVDWPATAFESPTSPLYVCVVGNDDFGRLVMRAAAGQHLGKRAVAVRVLAAVQPDSICNIMYIGRQGTETIGAALAKTRGRPILTVTDEINGDERGVVHFVIHDGRVRFDIDRRLAEQDGLSISPKLLELAVEVRK